MPRPKRAELADPSPSRVVISHPPVVWYGVLKQELIAGGVDHDRAGLIARRVITALVPQGARIEAMDHRGESTTEPS